MTSRIMMNNALRPRISSHLWVNKTPYVDPGSSTSTRLRKSRFYYAWKPDRAEAHRIKRLSKGDAQRIITDTVITED